MPSRTTFRNDTIPAVEGSHRTIWLAWTRALRSFVEPLIRGEHSNVSSGTLRLPVVGTSEWSGSGQGLG